MNEHMKVVLVEKYTILSSFVYEQLFYIQPKIEIQQLGN